MKRWQKSTSIRAIIETNTRRKIPVRPKRKRKKALTYSWLKNSEKHSNLEKYVKYFKIQKICKI